MKRRRSDPPSARRLAPGLAAWVITLGYLVGCSGGRPAPISLCGGSDSSDGIRLLYRNIGGGLVQPGSQVLSENGFNFLVVDGQCHYWVRDDVNSEIREGVLSAANAQRVSQTLRLAEWQSLAGSYVDNLCDGPKREYRLSGTRIDVWSDCGGAETSGPVDWILDVANAEVARLYESSSAVKGAMRFVLVSGPENWLPWWVENAFRWQTATDLSAIALTFDEASRYEAGASVLASSEGAEMLRAARRSFLAKNGFQMTGGFLPVIDAANNRFELYARDVIPLEDAKGILHVE